MPGDQFRILTRTHHPDAQTHDFDTSLAAA
jgi:hypothetical protein